MQEAIDVMTLCYVLFSLCHIDLFCNHRNAIFIILLHSISRWICNISNECAQEAITWLHKTQQYIFTIHSMLFSLSYCLLYAALCHQYNVVFSHSYTLWASMADKAARIVTLMIKKMQRLGDVIKEICACEPFLFFIYHSIHIVL